MLAAWRGARTSKSAASKECATQERRAERAGNAARAEKRRWQRGEAGEVGRSQVQAVAGVGERRERGCGVSGKGTGGSEASNDGMIA